MTISDYQRIAKAIDYIVKNVESQPSLKEVADHIHLSQYHFQRLFRRWAGVTPKRFLQVLTLEKAKSLLNGNDRSLLEVSDSMGLSSGSRLYDHFVHIEAVTPSEYKKGGAGLTIGYGVANTPFGKSFIAITNRGICRFVFTDYEGERTVLEGLRKEWPQAVFRRDLKGSRETIERMFNEEPQSKAPLSLHVRGTNFQINLWRALLEIPPGRVCSYGELARKMGKPKGARAVGGAVSANPVAFLIPCHRVIRQSGQLGGYRWGLTRKEAMLVREKMKYGKD